MHDTTHPAAAQPTGRDPTLVGILVVLAGYVVAALAGWPQHGRDVLVSAQAAHAAAPGAAAGHEAPGGPAATAPSPPTVLPFVLLLAAIAILPLTPVASHWWEHNSSKLAVAGLLGLVTLGYYAFAHRGAVDLHFPVHSVVPAAEAGPSWAAAGAVLANALLAEFVPFIVLLFALYVITGGVRIEGDLAATPAVNAAFLGTGALLASFIGTTGAAMLLVRPLLETNRERKHVAHTLVFFIFMVCNCGGCLLPIGDPPLFLGYLEGVPFLWTTSLWPQWAFTNGVLLAIYWAWDAFIAHPRETAADVRRDERLAGRLAFGGLWPNLPLMVGVIAAVALLDPSKPFPGTAWHPWIFLREAVLLALVALSLALGPADVRRAEGERQGDEGQEHGLAEEDPGVPGGARERLRGVEQGHGRDHADHERQVRPQAAERQAAGEPLVAADVGGGLPRVGDEGVPSPVDRQQHPVRERPLRPQRRGPQEGHALQVAEEQRRVADRQQAAAAVADHEDEEHERVGHVLPLAVRLQERPHEEHRRAGRADEAGEQRARAEERGVHGGSGREVALDPHAARDHVEREQEDDEGHELREQGVGEDGARGGPGWTGLRGGHDRVHREMQIHGAAVGEGVVAEGDQAEQSRDGELAGVVLPPVRRDGREGQDGDRGEEQHEGEHGRRRRRGGGRAARRLVPGGRPGRGGMGRLCGHQHITTMLRPAGECRDDVAGQDDQDPDESRVAAGRLRGGRVRGVVHDRMLPGRFVRCSGDSVRHRNRGRKNAPANRGSVGPRQRASRARRRRDRRRRSRPGRRRGGGLRGLTGGGLVARRGGGSRGAAGPRAGPRGGGFAGGSARRRAAPAAVTGAGRGDPPVRRRVRVPGLAAPRWCGAGARRG